ncbi:hypothetical protein ACVOMT_22680 [Sphingomonas panni]
MRALPLSATKYEMVRSSSRRSPERAIWQADHTELDILILDARGRPTRP